MHNKNSGLCDSFDVDIYIYIIFFLIDTWASALYLSRTFPPQPLLEVAAPESSEDRKLSWDIPAFVITVQKFQKISGHYR